MTDRGLGILSICLFGSSLLWNTINPMGAIIFVTFFVLFFSLY